MTNQAMNSSLLSDAAEIIEQACNAMSKKACDYILNDPLEYYNWQSATERGRMLRAQIQLLAEKLQKQEQDESVTAPQFSVGDTVRYDGVETTVHKADTSGIIVLNNGAWVTEQDLTLVKKAVKP